MGIHGRSFGEEYENDLFVGNVNDTFYNYSLDISARDVNQLHSKVYYFDSNKTEIKWDFIFGGTDGKFKDIFNNTLKTPTNTTYIKLQMLARPDPQTDSYYVLDDANIYPYGHNQTSGR